jgi:hypothetical protein
MKIGVYLILVDVPGSSMVMIRARMTRNPEPQAPLHAAKHRIYRLQPKTTSSAKAKASVVSASPKLVFSGVAATKGAKPTPIATLAQSRVLSRDLCTASTVNSGANTPTSVTVISSQPS